MNTRNCLLLAAIVTIGGSLSGIAGAAGNDDSPLGINLREIRYWGTELTTVDFFKRAGASNGSIWLTQCAWPCPWDTREQAALDLDQQGWPRSLPGADSGSTYRYVTTIIVGNTDKYPAGRWTVLYDGEGTLAYGFDALRSGAASTPGRDVFDVATPRNGIALSITKTDPNHTGNYLRNIRVIPPGGTCDGDPFAYAADASACMASFRPFTETYASQPFHPLFLKDMRPFSALRYVHFTDVINDVNSDWCSRSHLSDASWGYADGRGAPIEAAIDLANTLNASPWFEIPARADDRYITEFARLVKSRLMTSRPIYLEYHNEAWNGAYPYVVNTRWIQDQANARWPTATASPFQKLVNWFGMRTKEVCAIWKQEFSDQPGRVKCVMGAQAANPWVAEQALSCPLHAAEAGGGACDAAAGIDAVAIAPYVGAYISDPVFQPQIESGWLSQPDGGLSQLFAEISYGGVLARPTGYGGPMATVPWVNSRVAAHKPVADQHGVKLVAYEGGNELFGRNNSSYQTQIQALSVRAQRDLRMGDVFRGMHNGWKAAGGDLFMVYESTGAFSAARGNSALLEWQGEPASQAPRYAAALGFIAANPCWWPGCGAWGTPPYAPAPRSAGCARE